MRKLLVLAALCASCDGGPPARPTDANDLLWRLAPAGAKGGVVISPYALGMLEDGSLALRDFVTAGGPELEPFQQQLDAWLAPVGGAKTRLADLGLARDKGAALFFGEGGKLTVVALPIANRDTFVTKAGGTRATTPDGDDTIQDATCRVRGPHYVCSRDKTALASLGQGALQPVLATANARGDIELVAQVELGGEGPSDVVAVATLERGELVMRGLVTKAPAGLLDKLGPPTRPKTAIGRSAGFGVLDLRPVLKDVPPLPLVEGVTIVDVANTLAGPLVLTVPAGEMTIEMEQPLTDPAPMTKALAKCDEVGPLREFDAKLVNGTCQITLPEAGMTLDVWVEGNAMRIGKKGATAKGASVPLPAAALEMATGQWGLVLWGRGTMFAPTGKPALTTAPEIPPASLAPVRALAMMEEAGLAMRKETTKSGDAVRFLLTIRTGFANPAAVVTKLSEIKALDVAMNTAPAKAEPIAKAHPGTPFAGDYAAGQAGLLLATYLIGAGTQVIAPMFGGAPGGAAEQPAAVPPGARTKGALQQYAALVYPEYLKANAAKPCPTMAELAAFVSPDATTVDEWGKPIVVRCGKDLPAGVTGIALVSPGADGELGTADDLTSY